MIQANTWVKFQELLYFVNSEKVSDILMTIDKNWTLGSNTKTEVENHTFFEYIKNNAYLVELNQKQKEGVYRDENSVPKQNHHYELVFNFN